MTNYEQHIDLSDLNAMLATATPKDNTSTPVPNGVYQAFVRGASVEEHEGVRQLKWELTIMAGPHKGRRLWRRNALNTQENLNWLLGDLQTAKLSMPSDMNELYELARQLLHMVFEVRVSTSVGKKDGKTYTNVNLRKRLSLPVPEDLLPDVMEDIDLDDLPF